MLPVLSIIMKLEQQQNIIIPSARWLEVRLCCSGVCQCGNDNDVGWNLILQEVLKS